MRKLSLPVRRDAGIALLVGTLVFAAAGWAYGSGTATYWVARATEAVGTEVLLLAGSAFLIMLGIIVEALRMTAHGAMPRDVPNAPTLRPALTARSAGA